METLKNENLWLTRRNTRSSSNQEKENKEKIAALESKQEEESKKKEHLGSIVRGNNNEVIAYSTLDGTTYNLLDSAYIATERADNPYFIGTIQEIKVSKKDHAILVVKWYYRPAEVPDTVYQMLLKDRLDGTSEHRRRRREVLSGRRLGRELFIADDDIVDVFPVSGLRGKCSITHLDNFEAVQGFETGADNFFYILSYNPETRRLASAHHGEVRVGPSHQWTASTRGIFHKATIPDMLGAVERGRYAMERNFEEMTWKPKVNDVDLKMFLCSARSMAAFAGMCDGGSPEEGVVIASRDDITINALAVLFENKMDTRAAVQSLVKNPLPVTIERRWTEDQVKRFQKGLRQNGKNFFKIRKDLLQNKQTSELVEFYYLWKKVQEALLVQPQHKNKRQTGLRRSAKKENADNSIAGEDSSSDPEYGSEGSDKEMTPEKCHHCHTTTSEDWMVGGRDGFVLCTECRVEFKKYGVVRNVDLDFDRSSLLNAGESPPRFMFKPIKEKAEEKVVGIQDKKKAGKRQWADMENIKEEVVATKGNAREIDQSEEAKSSIAPNPSDVVTTVATATKPQVIKPAATPICPITPQKPLIYPLAHGGTSPFTQVTKVKDDQQQMVGSPVKEPVINHPVQPSSNQQTVLPSNQPQVPAPAKVLEPPPVAPSNQPSQQAGVHGNHGDQQAPGNQIQQRAADKMVSSDWPTDDETPPIRVPRENHVTVPAGQPWPPEFKFFDDGLPAPPRGSKSVVCYKTEKLTLLGHRDHLCSRTDLVWEPPKKRPLDPRPPQKVEPTRHHSDTSGQHRTAGSDHRGASFEQPRTKKDKPTVPVDLLQVKKERIPPRPQHSIHLTPGSSHLTPGQHHMTPGHHVTSNHHLTPGQHHITPGQHHITPGQHHLTPVHPHMTPGHPHLTPGSSRTPSHTPTPVGFDAHRPSHPAPYLGSENTASRTLRQIAYGESSHAFPYNVQLPQSERDLRERELREMRERIPKQSLEGMKLMDLDPASQAQAMLLRGLSPGMIPGFVNQQSALEQLRQPFPGLLGLPGTSQGGFPPFLPTDLQLHQSAVERLNTDRLHAERIAIEQYRMELLHNHQHSHVHSHLHLHPSNQPPLPPADPLINPYAAAAMQQALAAAAGVDPVHAATMTSQMIGGLRPPAPGMLGHPGIPPRPESLHQYLTASQQLQAVAHEQNFLEHQREEYMRYMSHKP